MNETIFIVIAFIALCIYIVKQYITIIKLNSRNYYLKEEALTAEVQRQDIVKISKSLFTILATEPSSIPTDRIPFLKRNSESDNLIYEPLDSIRLRLKDGKVLTYLNGTINPSKDDVFLYNITSIKKDHLELIHTYFNCIIDANIDAPTIPLTPQKIKNVLNYKS